MSKLSGLTNDERTVLRRIVSYAENRNWIKAIYLTGSRVNDYGERLSTEYGYKKESTADSDWDFVFHTTIPVINVNLRRDLAIHADATPHVDLPSRRTLIEIWPNDKRGKK